MVFKILLITTEHGCEKQYNLYTIIELPMTTEFQPTTMEPIRSGTTTTCNCLDCTPEISKIQFDQCTKTVTIQSCAKDVHTTTIYDTYTPTIVHVSICPSPSNQASSSICPSQPIPINIAIPATGVLVSLLIVLLLVVITGWVCTCRIMKKRGKMEINIMQDRYLHQQKKHNQLRQSYRWLHRELSACTYTVSKISIVYIVRICLSHLRVRQTVCEIISLV